MVESFGGKDVLAPMFDESAITALITESLSTAKPLFVWSAWPSSDLERVATMRDTAWSKRAKQSSVNDLAVVSLRFPWSEHPAHALFASVLEQWGLADLEKMLSQALFNQRTVVTTNTHLAAVLEGIAHPAHLGHADLYNHYRLGDVSEVIRKALQAYLLDPVPQATDRRRLGLSRSLTTQDRYELLACIWRCQQGLSEDRAPQHHTRLWVTLDEAENLLEYPVAERKLMLHGLTTLHTHLRSYFTFWLNIADTAPARVEEVKKACGPLWSRLDHDFTI